MSNCYFADYHTHTNHSPDSSYPMEQVIKDAMKIGLNEICLTDHVDFPFPTSIPDFDKYFADIETMQARYGTQILIKKGLEFGTQTHTILQYQEVVKKYPMDFILLSVHQIHDKGFWNGQYQHGKTKALCVHGYYQEILDVIKMYDDYSVLAHLDLIRRYVEAPEPVLADSYDLIVEILKTVIKKGKGIELNTSHIRYGLGDWMPARDILELYHDLGGKIITIGSDSHEKAHLGFYIKEGRALLKEIGFKEFCTFDKMMPIFHEL